MEAQLKEQLMEKEFQYNMQLRGAENKNIECYRDDPWNDYDFLNSMYGGDMIDWHDSLPKMPNHEYKYLCRIIKAVQTALKN